MAATRDTSTDSPRASRYWRASSRLLSWVLFAIAAYFVWPTAVGGATSMVIVSGQSMEPTYYSGDLVIARKGAPEIGDVIVYAPDGLGGAQVVHRIIGGDAESGWVLQGDNNDFVDPFYPAGAEVRGIVLLHVPNAGAITMWILNPLLWCGVILAGTVVALWPPKQDSEDEPGDDDDEPEDGSDGPVSTSDDVAAPVATAAGARVAAKPASRRRRKNVAFAALAGGLSLLAVACATPASAAQLSVFAGLEPVALTVSACAPARAGGSLILDSTATGAGAAGAYSQVSVSGIPAACAGLALEVFVHDAAGSLIASGTGSASSAATVAVSTYSAASAHTVIARIGGWIFSTDWTAPPPPAPAQPYSCVGATSSPQGTGQTCSVVPTHGTWWGNTGSRRGHQTFSVTTSAPNAIVTIDLSTSPFPGWTVRGVRTNSDWIKVPGYSCSELPLVRVYANPSNGGKRMGLYLEYTENAADAGSYSVICPGP